MKRWFFPFIMSYYCLLFHGMAQVKSVDEKAKDGSWAFPSGLIGYTELQTDLPGGRQPNVNTMRAVVMRVNGTGKRIVGEELVKKPDTWTQFAGWSPDGKIAIVGSGWKHPEHAKREEELKSFKFSEGVLSYDMYLADMNRGSLINVTEVHRVSYYNSGLFFWPGDPTKLGFTALINEVSHPFKMDRDGRNKTDLTSRNNGFTYGFTASRDGKRIAYHKDYHVYLANADGSGMQKIETGQSFNFAPSWSPDGKRLLFLSGSGNTHCDPYMVQSDGTGLMKLAERNGYKGSIEFLDVYDFHEGSSDVPVWSADGASVFFTALVGNTVELFRVFPGMEPVRLTYTEDGSLHYHPLPSPDGKWLLYGGKRKGVRQLFLMRLEDHLEKQLTHLEKGSAAMWPHWQPQNR